MKCHISNEMFTLIRDFCKFKLHVRWQFSNKNIKKPFHRNLNGYDKYPRDVKLCSKNQLVLVIIKE